jgi:hypothetical protein
MGEEGMLDCLGIPSPLGFLGIEPVGTPLPAQPMLIPSFSSASIVLPDINITYLPAAILPLV